MARERQSEGEPVTIILFAVPHTFDWSHKVHKVSGQTYLEVAHNDCGIAMAVLEETGALFVMDQPPMYVNRSVSAFFECIRALYESPILEDENLPDEARLAFFRETVLAIDPTCLSEPRFFWSAIAEEISCGLL